jgi:hypothetical protein
MRYWLWRYARKRARSAVYWADLDYRRNKTCAALERLNRALARLERLELNPPR